MIGNFANRCAQTGHGPKWNHVARAYAWRSLPAALALALCVLPDAHAQQNEDASSDTEQTTLPAIVVTATRIPQSSFDVPAAVGVVTQDDIVDGAPAFSLSQSLARIPGVVALDRQSYAQDSQISIRGFGSRASFGVRGIRLLVDGIPVSGPDGQGETDTFDLATAERIEVLRGPFSALYGNAAGGVIQLFTKDGPQQPTLGVSTLFGSYGTRIQRLDAGGTADNLNYVVDATHFHTDGYRQHSAAERNNLRAKFRYDINQDASLTLLFNGENQPFAEDPSSLTKQQARDTPRLAVPGVFKFGAGEGHRDRQLGGVYEQQFGQDDHLHVMGYGGTRRVVQFLPFSGGSANGGGAVVDLKDRSKGGGARWVHNFSLASTPLDLIAGVEYDHLHELRKGWVNAGGVEGDLRRNENNVSSQAGEYLQAEWKPDRWGVVIGLRHSRVKFGSDDHYVTPDDPDDSGKRKFASTNPVAGVLYKISPHLNVYANYGEGFETPTLSEFAYRPDGQAGFNQDLQPSKSRDYEAGLKGSWTSTKFELAVFHIATTNDIIVGASNDGRDSFTNAGSTKRRGVEINVQQNLSGGFGAYLAYSYLQAQFNSGLLDGERMPGVPRQMLYGELNWQYRPLGFSTALGARWSDRVYVDNENTDFANSYAVINYHLEFKQNTGSWQFSEYAGINNLFDRNYVGAVVVNSGNGRFFEPEPRRNFMLGLSANYAF
ncbi:MAG TPA: TonB-dependent receptor [Rhodanobacter sp.]|nr:TonB-dependent receptor [Rhodanobacter sp.]